MLLCDLNCDMGEGMDNDEALMSCITSANIACGFHAGNADTMRQTIGLALRHDVKIGAHPSFPDREHFGRMEMQLPAAEIYRLVQEQLALIDAMAKAEGATLHHVKPHGALYNMAADDEGIAGAIASAVNDFNATLVLYGMSGSCLIDAAKASGLRTASEVFADRTYTDEGRLTPRRQPDALIETEADALQQVMQMLKEGAVTATSGRRIPIVVETVCLHGDGPNALSFARTLYAHLQQESFAG